MAARPVSRAARSQRAVRAVATVLRFSARLDSMALRLSASDAVPWPDVVAAEPHGVPVQRAVPSPGAALDAPLPEGAPWQAVVRGGPWREVAQDWAYASMVAAITEAPSRNAAKRPPGGSMIAAPC